MTLEDSATILYSDAALSHPGRSPTCVPVVGYIVFSREGLGDATPIEWVEYAANLGRKGWYSGEPYQMAQVIPALGITAAPTYSTASVAMQVEVDAAFLLGSDLLPHPLSWYANQPGGKGLALYDLAARYSGLRRLSKAGMTGPLLTRTDGSMTRWLDGTEKLTITVDGENIAPTLIETVKVAERPFESVTNERLNQKEFYNLADTIPIREVKAKVRARRVA
ncbi:MAG: hypothetical protein HKL79_04260 [Thermoplasmata archaeon]|nr:hypothetical protein [Thermoplasmata archaeon]